MSSKLQTVATAAQKENFIREFEDIVKDNYILNGKYKIQFFEVSSKTNYVFNDLTGKSINILQSLSPEELGRYKELKSSWRTKVYTTIDT